MPRIADHKEIYSVAQRKKDFPEADWGFLLHTARNCAIAFESVHAHGHIVDDVNQKNVMVSKRGIGLPLLSVALGQAAILSRSGLHSVAIARSLSQRSLLCGLL